MNNQDIIYVDEHKVQCEGGDGAAGHPKIYLEIKNDKIACPYCSRLFKLRKIDICE